jgi:hypothetical protein
MTARRAGVSGRATQAPTRTTAIGTSIPCDLRHAASAAHRTAPATAQHRVVADASGNEQSSHCQIDENRKEKVCGENVPEQQQARISSADLVEKSLLRVMGQALGLTRWREKLAAAERCTPIGSPIAQREISTALC